MSIFFTSDLHLGHANIIKSCNRPFKDIKHMDETLIKNWNKVVSKNDIVWHLGDITLSKSVSKLDEYLEQLHGNINFILGNHDLCKNLIQTKYYQINKPIIKDLYNLKISKTEIIVLCHYSLRVWYKSHYGAWHLYGHSHGSLPQLGKSADVGIDSTNILGYTKYRPYSLDEIRNYMNAVSIHSVDKHC